MKHKTLLQTLIVSIFSAFTLLNVHAQGAEKLDEVIYLNSQDTVLIDIDEDKRKFTKYTLKPQQTLYSLSRFFAQDISMLYSLNPELRHQQPQIGQELIIEVPNSAIVRFRTNDFKRKNFAPIYYTIKPGETMYKIAKNIFGMSVDTLTSLNSLEGTGLSIGQKVQVGWTPIKGSAHRIKKTAYNPLKSRNQRNYIKYKRQNQVGTYRRGVASWSKGSGEASGKLFALINNIPIGEYVKVKNLSNNKIAYVEVIGSLPTNTIREKVDIQISSTAARILGVRNPGNFYVILE